MKKRKRKKVKEKEKREKQEEDGQDERKEKKDENTVGAESRFLADVAINGLEFRRCDFCGRFTSNKNGPPLPRLFSRVVFCVVLFLFLFCFVVLACGSDSLSRAPSADQLLRQQQRVHLLGEKKSKKWRIRPKHS
jgi:hypothetical protein